MPNRRPGADAEPERPPTVCCTYPAHRRESSRTRQRCLLTDRTSSSSWTISTGTTGSGGAGADWVRTPNIDAIAGRGVRLTHCIANSPLCAPSRIALATGRRPGALGALGNDASLPLSAPTMYQRFRDSGYHVACTGKLDLAKRIAWLGRQGESSAHVRVGIYAAIRVLRARFTPALPRNRGARTDSSSKPGACTRRFMKIISDAAHPAGYRARPTPYCRATHSRTCSSARARRRSSASTQRKSRCTCSSASSDPTIRSIRPEKMRAAAATGRCLSRSA